MFFFLLCLVGASFAAPLQSDDLWHSYKQVFGKKYSPLEDGARRAVWENTVARVQRHNIEADLGIHSFKLSVNAMSDKIPQEYLALNGLITSVRNKSRSLFMAPANVEYPDHVDWRERGLVTEVKDQKNCGSCWAFSATGSLEGQHKRKTGQLVSLSEQNLVDCATAEGNAGCGGGSMDAAFEYIQKHGIDTEESYPYTAKDGICTFNQETIGATLTGWIDVDEDNEDDLLKAVATVGPVSVAINANGYGFTEYSSGIYDTTAENCNPNKLNHGVLIVGYGTEEGKPYWIVKNSWGASWGDKGYIRMSRNKNQCGIASMGSYPLV